jgi:predicted nucleic acid-binding protein
VIVLDTNVVSELMRSSPDPQVLGWLEQQVHANLNTTAVSVAEIHYGICRLAEGRRRSQLAAAAEDIFGGFASQILPFNDTAALHYGYGALVAERDRARGPISALDGQIAAICRASGSALATRNTGDFEDTGVELLNPWLA